MPWIAQNGLMKKAMEISAKELLDAGVTSAIDLGAPLKEIIDVRDRINKGEIPGPRMSVSGPWITKTPSAVNTPEMAIGMATLVHTPLEAAAEVDRLADAGVDVIKAYTDLTPADYKAIVTEAHKRHIKVQAHVYSEIDVRNAFEAGVDVLTHVGSGGTAPPYTPELIRDVMNAGRPVVTTIAHRSWLYPDTMAFPERLEDPQLKIDMGPQIWAEVHESLKNWYTVPYFRRSDREVFFREKVAKQWIDSGAIMGMGTDSGSPGNFHTESLWREMKAHVDMGMSPQRVISATTRVNATAILGKPDLGTIEVGKLADVIVVNGNPMYDMTAVSHVDVVVKGGIVYKDLLTKK
jgi:imidazolonepropionase-like amidohydrolase